MWSLPNTLLGLGLGALTFQTPRIHGGAIVFDRTARGVTWLLERMHRTMTVGFVILSARPLEGHRLAHERHHVRHSMLWGPLLSPSTWRSPSPSVTGGTPWSAARRASGEEP